MDITINFSTILQVVSLVFTIGGIGAWVRYSINTSMEHDKEQDVKIKDLFEKCEKVQGLVKDVQHSSITRDEAYKAFVAKEVMDLHLKNIEKSMGEIKILIQQIHIKRTGDQ